MALRLVWTEEALNGFESTLDYIERKFGWKSASKYAERVEETLTLLTEWPDLGSFQLREKKIRGFVVRKRTTIIYTQEVDSLIILNVFDNRQDPRKRIP